MWLQALAYVTSLGQASARAYPAESQPGVCRSYPYSEASNDPGQQGYTFVQVNSGTNLVNVSLCALLVDPTASQPAEVRAHLA